MSYNEPECLAFRQRMAEESRPGAVVAACKKHGISCLAASTPPYDRENEAHARRDHYEMIEAIYYECVDESKSLRHKADLLDRRAKKLYALLERIGK